MLAAGVLPISVDPQGQIVCLLGQENADDAWDEQLTWCGFGGDLEEGETLLYTTSTE